MQPSTSVDWGRVLTLARWAAILLSGVALVGWAVWTIVLVVNGTATLDVVQWILWGAIVVDLAVALLGQGAVEYVGGVLLVAGAAAMGIVSGWEGPALLAVPLLAIAGGLFTVCGRYTPAHPHVPAPHAKG